VEKLLRRFLIFLSASPASRWVAVRFPLTRKVARRFVAGETLEDALSVTRALISEGFLVSLDLLGENVDGLGEARAATEEVLRSVEALGREGMVANVSCKLTQLGLDEDVEVAKANLRRICQATRDTGMVVRVDMEGSAYTEVTLNVVTELHRESPHLATVLQSYMLRTVDDVARLNREGVAVRLCKGAYAEPPEIAFQEKAAVDEAYLRAAEELLANGSYPAIATHDETMIQGVLEIVRRLDLCADDFEFQMLYGIRQDRQRQLLRDGWRVRLYVPYGNSWYPYFMRRLAERPANLWFMLTALLRG
jgi:proline dehydrogenase